MQPYSLIISDLHLSHDKQDAYQLFSQFLAAHHGKANKMFILGDFFEFWIGDDDPNPFYKKIIQQLKHFANGGTELFFMHGNRDFLIGQQFCTQSRMTLLTDPTILTLHGHKLLLTHGDLLCTQDKRYQRYRKVVSQKWLQWLFIKLPLRWRLHIAQQIRQDSKKQNHKNQQRPYISNVDESAVEKWLSQYQVNLLIHGHTHQFGTHQYSHGRRLVLSDWHQKGSFIIISRNTISLKWY